MDNESVIQIRNLTKVYRDFWGRKKVQALNSLSLDVKPGEVFGLLGPNGSGKTTTLKLLLGLLFPTEGEITVLGKPAHDVEKNERIGYLPEESYLYRFLNADETLDFYGRLFNMSAQVRKERKDQLIELVGLQQARRRQLKEYSKGMTRRIGLAQALINDPDLVLLDEPTSGLDPLGTRDMKDMILRLREQGKTVVMCSHLLADVQDVCDRIAILYSGELKVIGSVAELLQEQDETQILTTRLSEPAIRRTSSRSPSLKPRLRTCSCGRCTKARRVPDGASCPANDRERTVRRTTGIRAGRHQQAPQRQKSKRRRIEIEIGVRRGFRRSAVRGLTLSRRACLPSFWFVCSDKCGLVGPSRMGMIENNNSPLVRCRRPWKTA